MVYWELNSVKYSILLEYSFNFGDSEFCRYKWTAAPKDTFVAWVSRFCRCFQISLEFYDAYMHL